jgi:hypothetical protein
MLLRPCFDFKVKYLVWEINQMKYIDLIDFSEMLPAFTGLLLGKFLENILHFHTQPLSLQNTRRPY